MVIPSIVECLKTMVRQDYHCCLVSHQLNKLCENIIRLPVGVTQDVSVLGDIIGLDIFKSGRLMPSPE